MKKFDWTNSSLARWGYVLLTRNETHLGAFIFITGVAVGFYTAVQIGTGTW